MFLRTISLSLTLALGACTHGEIVIPDSDLVEEDLVDSDEPTNDTDEPVDTNEPVDTGNPNDTGEPEPDPCRFDVALPDGSTVLMSNELELYRNPGSPGGSGLTPEVRDVLFIDVILVHDECPDLWIQGFTLDVVVTDADSTYWVTDLVDVNGDNPPLATDRYTGDTMWATASTVHDRTRATITFTGTLEVPADGALQFAIALDASRASGPGNDTLTVELAADSVLTGSEVGLDNVTEVVDHDSVPGHTLSF